MGTITPRTPAARAAANPAGSVADILQRWDRAFDLDSVGAVLWREFLGGFSGDDPTMPSIKVGPRIPGPQSLGDLEASGVAAGRSGINVENHFANLDPVVAIRQMSDDLSFAVGGR